MRPLNAFLVWCCAAISSTGAWAATQGTLGATSNGSFNNTFNGTTAPQVQILGVSDSVVTPATGQVPQRPGQSAPGNVYGSADQFCVVNTSGGAVTLSVSSDLYGPSAQAPAARAAGGSLLEYALGMHVVGNSTIGHSFRSTSPDWTIPAGMTATSAGACGSGNVRKVVYAVQIDGALVKNVAMPTNGNVYVGTITITATPE